MKKTQLSQLVASPTNEWTYGYQLPTDRIGDPFAVFASEGVGASPIKEFEIFGDKLFTNHALIIIDYPFKPAESAFPGYFTEFLVQALASALAIPVTDQTTTADYYRALAYGTPGENGNGGALSRARRANSAQQPPQRIEDFTLVNARF